MDDEYLVVHSPQVKQPIVTKQGVVRPYPRIKLDVAVDIDRATETCLDDTLCARIPFSDISGKC